MTKVYTGLIFKINNSKLPQNYLFEDRHIFQLDPCSLKLSDLLKIREDEDFVANVHLKLLDKHPSKEEVEEATAQIEKGKLTRKQFIINIMDSRRFQQRRVKFPLIKKEL